MTTLGYWNLRGVGQPIRLLLAYLGVEFTNKVYTLDGAEWFEKDKKELNIPLPNLPYLIDEDIKLTESSKYKKFELLGQTGDGQLSQKEIRVEQILSIVNEFKNRLFNDNFNSYYKFEEVKEKAYEGHVTFLKKIINHLGDKEFLEDTLSFADFILYETLLYFKHLYPQAEIPTHYVQRFENIPKIKEYLESPKSLKNFD